MSSTILIADDDPDILEILRARLRAVGYRTVEAADGEQATRVAESERPALAILDVIMPMLDGYHACFHIKKRLGIPVLILTGNCDDFQRLKGQVVGADEYVTKPFDMGELLALVARYCHVERLA